MDFPVSEEKINETPVLFVFLMAIIQKQLQSVTRSVVPSASLVLLDINPWLVFLAGLKENPG